MKIGDRMDKLEDAFVAHLTESGEIRTDLKWLKKAYWTLAGLGVTFNSVLAEEVIRHIWR